MLPSISLIVPARNEEKVIKKCLDSLITLDYPRNKLEIIVAIDGSTDKTKEICQSYGKKIKIIESDPKKCKADALNHVIPQTGGEIIGIYDSDCIVEKNALKIVAKNFSDNKVAAVSGNLKSYNKEQNLITKSLALETSFISFTAYLFSSLGSNPYFFGKHMFLRKKVLDDVGYFDTEVFVEDVEMSIKLKRAGYKVVFEPNAIAWHEEPPNLRAFISQRTRWARGAVRLLFSDHVKHHSFFAALAHSIYFYLPPTGLIAGILLLLSLYFVLPIYVILPFLAVFLFFTGLLIYSRFCLGNSIKDLAVFPVWFLMSNIHLFLLIKGFFDEISGRAISWNSVRTFS